MSDTDQIKDRLDIAEFIGEYIPLKKAGRNFKANCPFHGEKTPSFVVSPERQIWHCFGACDEGGDIFKFYMKMENVSFPEALVELAKKAGVTLQKSSVQDEDWQHKEKLYRINHLASEYYHYLLTKHEIGTQAREYLKKRGIRKRTMETFMMGYAPDGWRNVLPFLEKKGFSREEIEQTGLIIKSENNYYDRFRGRIMFTLKDHRGNIVGFSGRSLNPNEKQAKYINSPETILYHKSKLLFGLDINRDAIRETKSAIIAEGEFDVLSAFQEGIGNIVAIKGTALTLEQLTILKRITNDIVLSLDTDVAGNEAARRSIELAEQMDFNIHVLKLPEGKDIDEALSTNPGGVKKALKHTLSVYDFIINTAIEKHGTDDVFARKKIAKDIVPFLSRIINPIVKNFYTRKLAETVGVDEDAISESIEKELRKQTLKKPGTKEISSKPIQTRVEKLEMHFLAFAVQADKPAKILQNMQKTITIDQFATPAIRRILESIDSGSDIPKELEDIYNKAYLDTSIPKATDEEYQQELYQTIRAIRETQLRKKLKSLAGNLKEADNVEAVNKELQTVSNELKMLQNGKDKKT